MAKEQIYEIMTWIPSCLLAASGIVGYTVAKKFYESKDDDNIPYKPWKKRSIKAGSIFIGFFMALLFLPIGDASRAQMINFIGMAATGVVALSSTTFIGNAMAGLMLKSIKSFERGDIIETAEVRGRVTEKRILHTEIQTENRDLVTIPNLKLVTGHVRSVRSCGTVIKSEISLGYDVPRVLVSVLLEEACERSGLDSPFCKVESLGDYSVVYTANGILKDIGKFFSAGSTLRSAILDVMHENGVEIVSPKFINQRIHPLDSKFIPPEITPIKTSGGQVEKVLFDKADNASSLKKISKLIDVLKGELAVIKQDLKRDPNNQELIGKEANIKDRLVQLKDAYERRSGG